MENTMRRNSVIKFRRYIFIFFSLLFVFIWLNHGSHESPKAEPIVQLPSVQPKNDQKVTPHPNRFSLEYEKVQRFHERLLRRDTDLKENPIQSSDDADDEDDVSFMSDIKRRKSKMSPASRFFVNNNLMCKMPYVDPFSSEAVSIPKPVKWKKCSNESQIFALTFDRKLQQYRLQVDRILLEKLNPNVTKFKCNYKEVANNTITLWQGFQSEAIIDLRPSGIVAECHEALRPSRIIQLDAFPLVQVPYRKAKPLENRMPSILMLGLEGLSRMNFKRSMPKTAEFVSQKGWFEMEGYNKVGDSAFSNLCAIIGGAKSDTNCLKRFSMLWKAYKNAGYTTAFGEDSLESSVPSEFRTDYHLRTLLENLNKSKSITQRPGFEHCIGRRSSFSYLYDFCMQFAQRVIEELNQPAFGFFWSSTYTRDYVQGATSLDEEFVEYLELMRKHQVFERAIVILFSDQGQTSGDLVNMADGFLEERLPMLHIYLPPWYQKAYPRFAFNLQHNRNRLTSTFDLHNTLRHILYPMASVPKELASLVKCRNSQSLMHLMPMNRSCDDACIGLHWCACNEFLLVPNNMDAYSLGKMFVYHINKWMLKNHFNRFCQRLRLAELDYVERMVVQEQSHRGINNYRLRIHTFPKGGIFETTLRYNLALGKMIDINVRDISSLNDHKSGGCVTDRTAKKFCFCYPKLKDEDMKIWSTYKI